MGMQRGPGGSTQLLYRECSGEREWAQEGRGRRSGQQTAMEYPNELVEDRDNTGGLRGQWRPAWPVEACMASGGLRGQ